MLLYEIVTNVHYKNGKELPVYQGNLSVAVEINEIFQGFMASLCFKCDIVYLFHTLPEKKSFKVNPTPVLRFTYYTHTNITVHLIKPGLFHSEPRALKLKLPSMDSS